MSFSPGLDLISSNGSRSLKAAAFPLLSYSRDDISSTWISVKEKFPNPDYSIRAAVFNAGQSVFKPFLEITPEEIQNSLEVSISAAFAFSREAILTFKDNHIEEPVGKRGMLIFTGATASLRGNTKTSLLAAGKFGARALSQSLAKEFGKDNIHVRTYFRTESRFTNSHQVSNVSDGHSSIQ